jgi:mannose-1-phosphate guanylyltransferase
MFVWRVSRILEEMQRHMPSLYSRLVQIEDAIGTSHEEATFNSVWPGIATEMIDYGVMEKADRVAVLPADIGWKDMGSWTAVYEVLPHDDDGNAIVGKHISQDTHGTLVYSPNRLVATVGLEDMVVVDTGDALLICPRSRAQEVKQLVDQLKQLGLSNYLKDEEH